MAANIPVAMINGGDNFLAELLGEELIKKDIKVIREGETDESVNYVFDFLSDKKIWQKAVDDGARLTVIAEPEKTEEIYKQLQDYDFNWRVVGLEGVFGVGMSREGWIGRLLECAVRNKPLELPAPNLEVRMLPGRDAVEAILRATLMSGTSREKFLISGESYQSNRIAEILFNAAKMTRKELAEKRNLSKEGNKAMVEREWAKIRWKPEADIKEAITLTLQYFFGLVEEESRNKKYKNKSLISKEQETIENMAKNRRLWEVEVEDNNEELRVKSEDLVEEKNEEIRTENEELKEVKEEPEYTGWTKKKENEEINDKYLISNVKLKNLDYEDKKETIEENEEIEESADTSIYQENLKPVYAERPQSFKPIEYKAPEQEVKPIQANRSRLRQAKKWNFKLKIKWELAAGLAAVIILVFGVSLVTIGIKINNLVKNIEAVGELLEGRKYDEANEKIEINLKKVKNLENQVDSMGLKNWEWARNYAMSLKVMEGVLDLEGDLVEIAKTGEIINEGVFGQKNINWSESIKELDNKLAIFESKSGVLQARLNGDWNWLPSKWHSLPSRGSRKLDEARGVIGLVRKSLEFVPNIIGAEGKRKEYLVLFQNENELRPGGGFIGSYALLSFDGGKLLNLEIKDVYEADGQLKGHVEPPEEIKTHLGEGGWYMRDANWNADFKVGSKDIMWFYEKEMGRKVDGVIGINLATAKEMLGVIGEVYVPDFGEKINKDNLYEQAEFYSENKFFPGSKQKASFLGLLGKQLFEEIKSTTPTKRVELVSVLIDLLERNEIQLAVNDKTISPKIGVLGWDGGLYDGKCSGENCFTDYLYVVEANLGVNKANYFLYRNMDMVVELSNRAVARVLKINYENSSKSSNWPGGDYKNYLRLYIPSDANIAEVSVYKTEDQTTRKIFRMDELKIKQLGNKKEIGFLVTVPNSQKRTVEIRYTNEIDLSSKEKFSYLCYIQRQSGYGNSGLVSLVSYPEGWQPMQVQPAANLVGNKLLFNQKFDRDLKMGVEIAK